MKNNAINLILEEKDENNCFSRNGNEQTQLTGLGFKSNLQRIFTPRYAFNEDNESVTTQSMDLNMGAATTRNSQTAN